MTAEPAMDSEHESDWETVSEGANSDLSDTNVFDLSLEQPVQKQDTSLLREIPVSEMIKTPNMAWATPILTYTNADKTYERTIVSINLIKNLLRI